MKPTLQFTFDSVHQLRVFVEKVAPVLEGCANEEAVRVLKDSTAVYAEHVPAPVQAPAPVPSPAPTPVAPQPVPVAAPAPTPVAPQQTTLQDALQATAPAPVTPAPSVAATYTVDDLSRAAVSLVDAGRQPELVTLLQKYGVISLPELPPEQFAAFAADLRVLGVQI